MRTTPRRVACTGIAALALLAVACTSSSQDAAPPGVRVVPIKMRDFGIKVPKSIAAGNVVLRVRNSGPDTHELILVRAGAELPFRADDLTIDEDALEPRTVSVLEDHLPGTRRDWKLKLAPGSYVLFCNMSGHYLGGMHKALTVR